MVMLGVDVHKDSHTAAAVDEVGRELDVRTVRATDAGHRQLVRWARTHWPQERTWAVEDCRHVSTRLERALLAAGERLVRVPPKLMAGARDGARTRGKSDPIDALAIARAALREPDLPIATHDQPSRELKLLVDHREDLVAERTRMQNRLRWHLHELDPELDPPARGLGRVSHLDQLAGLAGSTATGATTRTTAGAAAGAAAGNGGPARRGAGRRHPGVERADRRAGTGDHRAGAGRGAAAAGAARVRGADRSQDRR
jgi:transposase